VVQELKFPAAGPGQYPFDISALEKGVYAAEMIFAGQISVQRIIRE
jgi:hypothetical protein